MTTCDRFSDAEFLARMCSPIARVRAAAWECFFDIYYDQAIEDAKASLRLRGTSEDELRNAAAEILTLAYLKMQTSALTYQDRGKAEGLYHCLRKLIMFEAMSRRKTIIREGKREENAHVLELALEGDDDKSDRVLYLVHLAQERQAESEQDGDMAAEMALVVQSTMAALDSEDRALIEALHIDGRSYRETAAHLKIEYNALRQRLFRALKRMKAAMFRVLRALFMRDEITYGTCQRLLGWLGA